MTPEERQRQRALLDIQRKREESDRKLEELRAKKQMTSSQVQKRKKTVTWKDGKNDGKGSQMEIVFVYPPDIDASFSDDDEDMWN